MSNLVLLLKNDIINSTGINKIINSDKKEKIKYSSMVALIIFSITILSISVFNICLKLADILLPMAQMELLLIIGFIAISGLCLFNSIYKAPSYLYQSRDYEMLASLPIKASTILISKMIKLILSNYLYSFMLIIIPALVYFIKVEVSITYLIYLAIMFLVTPLVPIVLASVISYFLGSISSKSRYKNTTLIIGSIAIILGLIGISYNMEALVLRIIESSTSIINIAQKIYPPSYYFVDGLKNNNIMSVLIFLGVSLAIFTIFIIAFSKGFNKINSSMNENYKINSYEVSSLKSSTPTKALINKEIKRYLSSYMYFLNTSIGVILLLVLSIGILIMGPDKIAKMMNIPYYKDIFSVQVTGMIIFCILMSCTTNSSISLEGKNLWILKSSPIDEIDIFKSKIYMNLILILPISSISLLIISLKLNFDIKYTITMFMLINICAIFTALYGLFINLIFPKLDYISETEVVKRSASCMVSTFSSMIYIGIFIAIYYFLKLDFNTILVIGIFITGLIDFILWKLIKSKGVKLFRELC